MPVGLVNVVFFRTYQDSDRPFGFWGIECGDGNLLGFVVTSVDGVLGVSVTARRIKSENAEHIWVEPDGIRSQPFIVSRTG